MAANRPPGAGRRSAFHARTNPLIRRLNAKLTSARLGAFRPLRPLPAVLFGLAALLGIAGPTAPLLAQEAKSGDEMLRNGIANLRTQRDVLLPGIKDATTALAAIRDMYERRRLAHRVISLDYPLDDFAGIVLADRYDDEYLAVTDSLASRFGLVDRDLPSEEGANLLRESVGTLPPITETSSPFVIAYIIGKVLPGIAALPADTPPQLRADASEAAVRMIGALTTLYRRSSDKREAADSWHESVVERLRCPTHKSSYKIEELRNGLRADGSLYRRYIVSCESGKEQRRLDFDLGAMGALSQNKGRQNLKGKIPPAHSRQPGVN